jgi:uncharacterized protein
MSAKDSAGFKLVVVLAVGALLVGGAFARKRFASDTPQPSASASSSSSTASAVATVSASTAASGSASASPPTSVDRAALLQAVIAGDVAKIDALHQQGVALTGILSPAARSGSAPLMTWLIDHGVDVHEDEDAVAPPIVLAEDHEAIVLLLLARGTKEPTLLQAIRAQAPKTVARVLSKKTDPNATTEGGEPALHVAIASGSGPARASIVKSLLDAGAKADGGAKADAGPPQETPLDAAIHEVEIGSDGALEVVKLLVAKAPVDRDAMSLALGMHSTQQDAVLDVLLAGKIPPDTAYRGVGIATDPKLVARIGAVAKGVAWNTKDPYIEDPPLLGAARRADLALVQALVAAGAPADGADESGETPLIAVVSTAPPDSEDATKVVTFLLGKGANANRKTKDGRRPLFIAAGRGSEATVKALLAKGANVNDDVNGITPLDAAEEGSHEEIVTLLIAKGAKRKPAPKN